MLKSAFKKRKMYEQLLETVPMLKTLEVINDLRELKPRSVVFFIKLFTPSL